MGRRRTVVVLGMALGMVLLAGVVAAVVGVLRSDDGPVYTVAQVQAGLQRHRMAWAGHTVRVHGMAAGVVLGHTITLYRCGHGPTTCTASVPVRTVAHLLLVPDGADAGSTFVGVSIGGRTVMYQPSMAAGLVPGVLVLVQPRAADTPLAALRRLPLVGSLIPDEGQGTFQRSGVYWVHIPTNHTCDSATQLCDDAILADVPQ